MSISITCGHCGQRNELGRMFCTGCGRRLDLSHTSLDDLSSRARRGRLIPAILRPVLTILLAAGVAGGGLVLWPQPDRNVERIRDGARLVPAKLDRLKSSARSGRASSAVFSAAELNGYLASQAEGPGPATVDIEVRAGAFELRGTRTLRPLAWLPVPALAGTALRVTYDLTGTFAQGRLNVTRVRIGHLPCVGPLRALPLGWLASVCDPVVNDRELVEAVRDVTLEANRAEVIVGR